MLRDQGDEKRRVGRQKTQLAGDVKAGTQSVPKR